MVGSRRNRSDNIWTPKSKNYVFHIIEIIIFRVSLLGFGENGDRRWRNDGLMMQRKNTPLPIPIKLLCTNFESKPSKTKVVSSMQPNPAEKPGVGFAYGRSSLTLLMSNFAQNRVSNFSDRDFCIKKLSKIFFIENSQNTHKWL